MGLLHKLKLVGLGRKYQRVLHKSIDEKVYISPSFDKTIESLFATLIKGKVLNLEALPRILCL